MPKIIVHERALAHLSRGLYRSPASALRELVSNAWDANAVRVTIDTNHPHFYQLSIEDDGDGFSREDFETLMSGGIGNSLKRTNEKPLKYGRPTIGRLGIGMLGIAQICGSFIVSSKPVSGTPFKARVNLYDLAKARMDEQNSELVHDAVTKLDGEEIESKIVDVGTYNFEEFDSKHYTHGTRILADDVVPTFTQSFQESLKGSGFRPVPMDWRPAVTKVLRKSDSLQLLGDYWRLLWELSASSPLPYLAGDAVPRGAVKDLHSLLSSYNFSLTVDGRQLFKPVYLKGNLGGYTTKIIPKKSVQVYAKQLTFSGYICVQEGKQLKPDELRGVMVRIKNVGIGYYDSSMLDFRINQGPRSRWVTGEIFVEEGLEDALNIDRDSFNRFHPEFRALQAAIHDVLQKEVFPEVYEKIDQRSEARRYRIVAERNAKLKNVLREVGARPVKITKRPAMSFDKNEPISNSQVRKNKLEVVVPQADALPVQKTSRQLAQSILTIFEVAMASGSKAEQRRIFSELLMGLLKRW